VPKAITVDNRTQFDAEAFKEFCGQIGMKIHFASVRHPESNGLIERANGIIMTGIMKLIFNQPRGKWPDELIKVVWCNAPNFAVEFFLFFTRQNSGVTFSFSFSPR
jgi:transposase InsO family protein